jgi:hypothetical protein
MWQDEWQAWLIARESPSLPDLFRNLRYEGHPGLWHLGLFLTSRITPSPLGMQLLHLLVATGSVYVFLRYSPFTRLEKLLFIFGYFAFYEYAVISRNYALGVLGLFSFCAIFCLPPPRNYLVLAAVLFLLCQTSVYGLMMAMVLGAILLWTALQDPAAGKWKATAAVALVLFGMGLSLIQLAPPPDSGFAGGWKLDLDFPRLLGTLGAVWKSYFPLPAPVYHFWGTNLISDPRGQAFLSVLLLAFGLLLFSRQPAPLFLYAVGTLGILTFTYVKYAGSLRHHGHLFLLFIASLWLSSYYPEKKSSWAFIRVWSDHCRANRRRVLLLLLAAQLLAGMTAATLDLAFPFSASKEAANFIKQRGWEGGLILGHADDAASSVAGYLGRRIYYPASHRWGSFIIWNQKREKDLEPGKLLTEARELSRVHQQDALLLLNYAWPGGDWPLIPVQQFTHSLVPEENYYLYLVPGEVRRP